MPSVEEGARETRTEYYVIVPVAVAFIFAPCSSSRSMIAGFAGPPATHPNDVGVSPFVQKRANDFFGALSLPACRRRGLPSRRSQKCLASLIFFPTDTIKRSTRLVSEKRGMIRQ